MGMVEKETLAHLAKVAPLEAPQTSTATKTSTSCSPLWKETSKEAPVGEAAVPEGLQTQGRSETETQTQTGTKETGTDSVAAPDP